MTIKPAKDTKVVLISMFVCLFFLSVVWIIDEMYDLVIPLMGILGILSIRYWIAIGRTIIIHEKGCSIKFLWYKKDYTWQQFKVIRVQSCDTKLPHHKWPYKRGVIFSIKNVGGICRNPLKYNIYFRPFSYFVVFFSEQKEKDMVCVYEMKEQLFRENMKKWDVKFEDCSERKMYL